MTAVDRPAKAVSQLVPCVRVLDWRGYKGWLPVMGPMHTDAEFINFPWPHFHIDWRFVPRSLFIRILGSLPGEKPYFYGMPIQCPDRYGKQVIAEGPVLKRRTIKRDLPAFPSDVAKWVPKLTEHMRTSGCTHLVNGACPHRGIPVEAMQRDGDILTCPGHGLRWNAISGELVQ